MIIWRRNRASVMLTRFIIFGQFAPHDSYKKNSYKKNELFCWKKLIVPQFLMTIKLDEVARKSSDILNDFCVQSSIIKMNCQSKKWIYHFFLGYFFLGHFFFGLNFHGHFPWPKLPWPIFPWPKFPRHKFSLAILSPKKGPIFRGHSFR